MTYTTLINITEEEKQRISELHDLTVLSESLAKKISEFRFTPDRKYVVFEEKLYSTETGEFHPLLLEKWSVSDILHTVGDVASMAVDFVIPGSGAIVDAINGVSYFIEGLVTKDAGKRKKLFIMGAVTMAFVIIPGPLQSVAIPMKRFIKYGAKKGASKAVMGGLKIIYKSLGKILAAIPRTIAKAVDSPLGKRVLGKMGPKISKRMGQITSNIQKSFDDLMDAAKKAEPAGPKDAAFRKAEADKIYNKKVLGKKASGRMKVGVRSGFRVLRKAMSGKLDTVLAKGVPEGPLARRALRKLGFGVGGRYRYVVPGTGKVISVKIVKKNADGIICRNMKTGTQFSATNGSFIFNAVAAPWVRRGRGRYVPFFVKRLTDLLTPEGTFDEQALNELPDLSIEQTSTESITYLREDLASYEGDAAQYTTNNMVTSFQQGLMALGYQLSRFGVDGKFGPETRDALSQFQTDASLESSKGRMDRLTAQKIAFELKARKIPNSEELQNTLNNI